MTDARSTPESEPTIIKQAREFVVLYELERKTIKSRILRPQPDDTLAFARAAVEFYEKSERAIDETLEKILNASAEQISATLRIEGHDPMDVATIARQAAEIAILKHDLSTRSESVAPENESHHGEGESVLTKRDLFIARCVSQWIATARKENAWYGGNWLPGEPDFMKSRLFWRLRAGKAPLPHPPPCCYSCPWYEVVEELSPHWTHECWVSKPGDAVLGNTPHAVIGQASYGIEKMADEKTPEIVTFGPWRFKVERAKHPQNADIDGFTIQRLP